MTKKIITKQEKVKIILFIFLFMLLVYILGWMFSALVGGIGAGISDF